MITNSVRLSEEIVKAAAICAPFNSRSVPKQIEHWAKIGRIAEENPDLSYDFIRGALEGRSEMKNNDVSAFSFRKK